MEGFIERIQNLCKEKGTNIKQLEKTLGFSNGYIINTGKRNSVPSADRIDKLAKYFGVSPDFIMGKVSGKTLVPSTGFLIPLLGRVAAGIPITAVENIIGQEEISSEVAALGEYFALRIAGDSMSPYIMDGDIVVVRQQSDADTGDIVIALIDGQDGVCKKLKKIDGGIVLISINTFYEPRIFTNAMIDTEPVRILGKVIEIRRAI